MRKLALFILILVFAIPVFAQEATPEATEEAEILVTEDQIPLSECFQHGELFLRALDQGGDNALVDADGEVVFEINNPYESITAFATNGETLFIADDDFLSETPYFWVAVIGVNRTGAGILREYVDSVWSLDGNRYLVFGEGVYRLYEWNLESGEIRSARVSIYDEEVTELLETIVCDPLPEPEATEEPSN